MSLVAPVATTARPDALNIADYLVARHVREGWGARTALVTGDGSISYSELDALVNRAGNVKYPRWIEFLPELPKTATGKLQRFRLR